MKAEPCTSSIRQASHQAKRGPIWLKESLRRLATPLRRFKRSEDGSYMVMLAIALIPMIATAGLAVDVGRGFMARTQLQSAIDAASLAMGSAKGSDEEIAELGRSFFYANFPHDSWATPYDLQISVERVNPDDPSSRPKSYNISAQASVNTLFFRVLPFGGSFTQAERQQAVRNGTFDHFNVSAVSAALTEVKGLEVVLVLDVTRSMVDARSGGQLRFEAMREATLSLIDILFADEPQPDLLRVAVVPYNTVVNIGTDMHTYVLNDGLDAQGMPTAVNPFGQTNWAGCVQARKDDHDLEDVYTPGETDGSGEWHAYRWPIEPDLSEVNGRVRAIRLNDQACVNPALPRSGDYRFYDDPLSHLDYQVAAGVWRDSNERIHRGRGYDTITNGPNKGCPGALLPLTNSYADVWDYLQNVTVVDSNGTITATGLNWGWRVISPEPPFEQGRPYDDTDWQKAIILLTDGQQTVNRQNRRCATATHLSNPRGQRPPRYNAYSFDPASMGLNGDPIENGGPNGMWTAYGYVAPEDSAPFGSGSLAPELEGRLQDTCDAVKDVKNPQTGLPAINIFAITFGDQSLEGSRTADVMKDCTTDPSNYFHAPDKSELENAFKEIAEQLVTVRLSD